MKYKHNDYYGYINKIQEQAIKNPQWFWSNDSKATEARQWLYNNGASKIVDEIYENTPDSVKKNIDSKKLSKHISDDIKTGQIKQDIYDRQKKFLDTAVAIGATTLPLIAIAPSIVTSPGTIVGGLVGGILSSMVVGLKYKKNKTTQINGIIISIIVLIFLIYVNFFVSI